MMQYDTNTDVIPPATRGVLELANMINPVTPEGQPTVASQLMQAAGVPPQAPQMPSPMPPQMGMQQVGKMAGLGAQVGAAQQQQEQQKMMQMLKQLAQRDQAMNFGVMAAPGAQQFKAPGMAGGGIVGYAGEERSDVSLGEAIRRSLEAEDSPIKDMLRPLIDRYNAAQIARQEKGLPSLGAIGDVQSEAERRIFAGNARPPKMQDLPIPEVGSAVRPENVDSGVEEERKAERLRIIDSEIQSAQQMFQQAQASGNNELAARYSGDLQALQRERSRIASTPAFNVYSGGINVAVPSATGIASVKPASTGRGPVGQGGIAQLVWPPVPSPLERREAEYKRLINSVQAPTVKTFEQLSAEDAAFRQSQGLPADPEAAARQRLDALRAEAEAEQKRRMTTPEGEMWNKLIAGLAGAAGKSNIGYMGAGIAAGTQQAAANIEDEKQRNFKLFREFKQAEAKELDLMEKAKEQRLYGRRAEADKLAAAARDFHNKKVELQANATMDFGKMEVDYAKMKSAEDIAKMEAASRSADRALSRESIDLDKLQSAYSAAQQRVVDATKKAQDILKERHPMAMLFEMNPEAKTKNPEAYANYITDRVRLERELIKPAVAQREALAAKLGFAQPATNAPAPGTVMDGYRFNGGNPADRANWEKV